MGILHELVVPELVEAVHANDGFGELALTNGVHLLIGAAFALPDGFAAYKLHFAHRIVERLILNFVADRCHQSD